MSRRTVAVERVVVEQREVLVCDRCGAEVPVRPDRDRGRIRWSWDGPGYGGDPGGGDREVDLCGACLSAFSKWLDAMRKKAASGSGE